MKIPVPKSKAGVFSLLFGTSFTSSLLIVINTNAFLHNVYWKAALTEAAFATQAFILFCVMVEADEYRTLWAGFGDVLGAVIGTLVSMWLSQRLGL